MKKLTDKTGKLCFVFSPGYSMKLILAILLLLISSCQQLGSPKSAPLPEKLKNLSIIYSGNRYSEIEPCNCVLKQLGGVNREWNITQRWRNATLGNIIYLSGGSTFAPIPKDYDPAKLPFYLNRAAYLVESLNYLGVIALSPSAEDLSLGTSNIKRLESSSVFPFISSNLFVKATGKPLFQPFLQLQHEKLSLVIIGLSGAPDSAYRANPDIEIRDPVDSLQNVFAALPSRSSLVILVSSLDKKQRDRVLKKYPQINLVLGAQGSESTTFNVRQENRNSLYMNPMALGRAISVIELEVKDPVLAFYNPWTASSVEDTQKIWSKRIKETETQMKNTNDRRKLEELTKKREEMLDYLIKTASVPMEASPDTIRYESETIEIDERYDLPTNDLNQLLSRYRESVERLIKAPKESKESNEVAEPLIIRPEVDPDLPPELSDEINSEISLDESESDEREETKEAIKQSGENAKEVLSERPQDPRKPSNVDPPEFPGTR